MSASEYIVQYGLPGYVGRFAADSGPWLNRGDRVIVRTPRGEEVGVIRCAAHERFSSAIDPAAGGELLRPAGATDDTRADELCCVAGRVLAAAQERATTAAFVDAEPLFDGSAVILHALPWTDADLTPLLDELSAAYGVPVRLFDVSRSLGSPEPPAKGWGKPGCGSGGCSSGGCSTGECGTSSCSSGKVKSADELTAYFADLRAKMEADTRRTPLHG